VTIGENSWLGQNHLYVQGGLFFIGLGLRILFVNGHRASLGIFLIFTIACAILVGYLFAGKSWCNYFCPMSPVQMIYTGPRSLLGSQGHLEQKPAITQSMCRTINPETGKEQSACVSCKMPCIDIDAEKTYWTELNKERARRLIRLGLMTDAGLAVIPDLDAVQILVEVKSALRSSPLIWENFKSFPALYR